MWPLQCTCMSPGQIRTNGVVIVEHTLTRKFYENFWWKFWLNFDIFNHFENKIWGILRTPFLFFSKFLTPLPLGFLSRVVCAPIATQQTLFIVMTETRNQNKTNLLLILTILGLANKRTKAFPRLTYSMARLSA